MDSKNIFIHIPKTGGTTINCAMNKTQWQTQPDFNYRHILYDTKCSNSADIFNPEENDKYLNYHLFMIVRNPIDRMLSEYFFMKDRREFMSLIRPYPKDFKSYIKNKQTQNYMIGFLLGKRIYSPDYVTEQDYEKVIEAIEKIDIHVGLFENYSESLEYFGNIIKIKWPKSIDVKRITLNRKKLDEIEEEAQHLIGKQNAWDMKFYKYCVSRFEKKTQHIKFKKNISFESNKYDYVLKYTQRFNLLEIGVDDKTIIKEQASFFQDLNHHLHHVAKIKNGEDYVLTWNNCFVQTMSKTFPDWDVSETLLSIDESEPLEKTQKICEALNKGLKGRNKMILARKKMVFNPGTLEIILGAKKTSSGLLSRIFGKK